MTEETRIESHQSAHTPEEHKKIEALKAVEAVQDGIRETERRIKSGQMDLADLVRQNTYDDFKAAEAEGYFTPPAVEAFTAKFEALFAAIHQQEAA